jgi:SAM-dependent methyltransferase
MLPIARQNAYRERYKRLRPEWRTSGERLESLIRRYLSASSAVLDVGCGRGGAIELVWRDAGLAVGVDPDYASLSEHRAGMPLVCGYGEALPFSPATFDLVIAVWLFEHVEHPSSLFAEVRRVLRAGGHFLFLTPNARHPLIWANRVSHLAPAFQRRAVRRLYARQEADTFHAHYRANTVARLRALAAAAGMRVVSLEPVPDPTYLAFNDALFRASAAVERWFPRGWGVHLVGDLVAS